LIPHALAPVGHPESDRAACELLLASLDPKSRSRVELITGTYGPGEAKHLIGRMDWFCGARMHSTIAALSSRTPAAATAYSPKFQGVFEACGLGHRVVDLASLEGPVALARLLDGFDRRAEDRERLSRALPRVEQKLADQLDAVADLLQARA